MAFDDHLKDENADFMNALTLAFIGDAVFERYVREIAVKTVPGARVNKLHRVCSAAVNAKSQAELLSLIEPALTEKELSVVRRGINSKPKSIPKHADIDDYLHATGFESLLGFLELTGDDGRLCEIFLMCEDSIKAFINGENK